VHWFFLGPETKTFGTLLLAFSVRVSAVGILLSPSPELNRKYESFSLGFSNRLGSIRASLSLLNMVWAWFGCHVVFSFRTDSDLLVFSRCTHSEKNGCICPHGYPALACRDGVPKDLGYGVF
jgi:hypothetical protein